MTTTAINPNPTARTQGPFTIEGVLPRCGKTYRREGITWTQLRRIAPTVGRGCHSIDVLDRHGNSVVFASDVLPLLEGEAQ